jgi:hypothetical protein
MAPESFERGKVVCSILETSWQSARAATLDQRPGPRALWPESRQVCLLGCEHLVVKVAQLEVPDFHTSRIHRPLSGRPRADTRRPLSSPLHVTRFSTDGATNSMKSNAISQPRAARSTSTSAGYTDPATSRWTGHLTMNVRNRDSPRLDFWSQPVVSSRVVEGVPNT